MSEQAQKATRDVLRTIESELIDGCVIKPSVLYVRYGQGVVDRDYVSDVQEHLSEVSVIRRRREGFDAIAHVNRIPQNLQQFLERYRGSRLNVKESDCDIYSVCLIVDHGRTFHALSCLVLDVFGNRIMTGFVPLGWEKSDPDYSFRISPDVIQTA